MEVIDISFVSVFQIPPAKKSDIKMDELVGGRVKVGLDAKKIFSPSFNGNVGRGLKLQPFQFIFEKDKRTHALRDILVKFVASKESNKEKLSRTMAYSLAKLIDNRTGQLLFAIAFGCSAGQQRIVLWGFPQDNPIQLRTYKGSPRISEIEDAFSKSSSFRKAAYFEGPISIGRNDLVGGLLIDSAAGRTKVVADYWLADFLDAVIQLLPSRGTNIIIKGLKAAQDAAQNLQEKDSVKAAFYSMLSQNRQDTTIEEFASMLVGSARAAYLVQFRDDNERNARFALDYNVVTKKIRSAIIALKNEIEIHLPANSTLDPGDFIVEENGRRFFFTIREEIDREYFR